MAVAIAGSNPGISKLSPCICMPCSETAVVLIKACWYRAHVSGNISRPEEDLYMGLAQKQAYSSALLLVA